MMEVEVLNLFLTLKTEGEEKSKKQCHISKLLQSFQQYIIIFISRQTWHDSQWIVPKNELVLIIVRQSCCSHSAHTEKLF